MLVVTGFLLLSLFVLHSAFVGSSGCLPYMLATDNYTGIASPLNASTLLKYDHILNINVEDRYLPSKKLNGNNLRKNNMRIDVNGAGSTVSANASVIHLPASYDYQFAFEIGELFLPEKIRRSHNFEVVNVTLMGAECFGGSTTQSLVSMGGIDSVVLNALMYTFRRPGNVITAHGDFYRWSAQDIKPLSSGVEWLGFKMGIAFQSVSAFFFLSTVTALLVRILISSGVVLLFPIFHLIQYFGLQPINLRIISLSYPWIGVPMEVMRARNQSAAPFLIGHLTRVVLYYLLYQAVQAAFSLWFYRPTNSPGQPELWLFALMMVAEYYTMIYVRARQSIALFPKAFFLLFVLYHVYYYSYPAGFHMLALATTSAAMVLLMTACIRAFEIKAYYTGVINVDTPRCADNMPVTSPFACSQYLFSFPRLRRALFNALPWPVLRTDLAPDFTLFMPVTTAAVGVYQANVPAIVAPGAAAPPINPAAAASAISGNGSGGSVRSPMFPAVDLEAGPPAASGRAGSAIGEQGVELSGGVIPPTYQSPVTGVADSSSGYRRAPMVSESNRNTGGGRFRGQYARLEGDSRHGRTGADGQSDEEM